MTLDIFVVAGNHREFQHFLMNSFKEWERQGLTVKQIHYVSHPDELDGVHGARVFLYGTYFKRPDWPTLQAQLKTGDNRPLLIR